MLFTFLLGLSGCTDNSTEDSAGTTTCEPLVVAPTQDWGQQDLLGERAPPAMGGNAGIGLGDVDGDGWLDALIVTPEGSLGLINDGSGVLEEKFEVPEATGVALADIDGDGDLDAWLGQMHGLSDRIWINDGAGAFTASDLPDSTGESTTGSFGDVDGDGDLDLFVARYAAELDPERILDGTLTGGGNALYRNDEGAWARDDGALPAEVVEDLTFQGQWLDADQDGDLDLYLANDFGAFLGPNRLLLNDGHGQLSLDEDCACDLAMFAMGAAVGDANADGHPDLFLTDLAGPDLLLSVGDGTFYEASAATGATVPNAEDHLSSWGTAFVDLDRDGHEDLPMVFGPVFPEGNPDGLSELGEEYAGWIDGASQRDVLLRATGTGQFEDISAEVGFEHDAMGRALAVGDLDQDGRADLVTAGLWYARAWQVSGGCENGVTVRLPPGGTAIGSRIEASVEGRTLVRWLQPATTWSSSAHEVVVGLGNAQEATEIRVVAADGTETNWRNVEAGTVLEAPVP